MKKLFTTLMIAVVLSLTAQQNFTYEYQLPNIDTNYYHSAPGGVTNFLLDVTLFPTDADWPFVSLQPGETIKIEYMLPAGCAYANISGESNDWQAGPSLYTRAGAFDYNPAQFYLGSRPTGDTLNCYEYDLDVVTASLNVVVYGDGTPYYPVTTETTVKYFSLYYPIGATGTFEFANLRFNLLIMDVDVYTAWQEDYFGLTTSISVSKENKSFNIYPNPASNNLQLITNNEQLGGNVYVLDVTGKVVISKSLRETKQSQTIDISNLQNGVYFIRIGNSVNKFVKE